MIQTGASKVIQPETKKCVLILEDEKDLGEALSSYLDESGFKSTWCESAAKASEALTTKTYDILICDIRLNADRYGGLDFLSTLSGSAMSIILMTGYGDYESVKRGINLQVDAYLEKPFDFSELVTALKNPRQKKVLSKTSEDLLNSAGLTPRELEVLNLLKQGFSNKEIAHRLGNSVKTTKTHLTSIYKKFAVKSRAQLISRLFGQ